MFDYYSAARFEILESIGLLFDPSGREPWQIIPVPPGAFGHGLCGALGTRALLCMFVARKTAESLEQVVPTQSLYASDPVRPPPSLRWFPSFTMRDGIRTEVGAHEKVVLGPFNPDSGLAWYAVLPADVVEGDTMDAPVRSPLALFENDTLIGPAHTDHETIRRRGGGAYSHWNKSLLLSTTDGTDPNTNGRSYVAAVARLTDYEAIDHALAEGRVQITRTFLEDYIGQIGYHPMYGKMLEIKRFSMLSVDVLLLLRALAIGTTGAVLEIAPMSAAQRWRWAWAFGPVPNGPSSRSSAVGLLRYGHAPKFPRGRTSIFRARTSSETGIAISRARACSRWSSWSRVGPTTRAPSPVCARGLETERSISCLSMLTATSNAISPRSAT